MIHRAVRERNREKETIEVFLSQLHRASANRDTIAIGTRDTRRNGSVLSLGSTAVRRARGEKERTKMRKRGIEVEETRLD